MPTPWLLFSKELQTIPLGIAHALLSRIGMVWPSLEPRSDALTPATASTRKALPKLLFNTPSIR